MSLLFAVLLGLALPGLSHAAPPAPGAAPMAEVTTIPRGLGSPRSIAGVKAATAVAGTAVLGLGLWLERRGRGDARRRTRDAALAALGLLGLACWWNLGQFHYPGFAHRSDSFHYYLGAKYFPELGYTGLYACVAVADQQAGLRGPLLERPMRNLETNTLETTATALADPSRCTDRFTPQRWAAFRHDVDFLRATVNPRRWARFQQDHGYNATPAWGVLGRALTSTGPASAAQLALLRALDPALLALMWVCVVWAFGWRVASAAALFWGTNYLSPYGWTGGSILRQDWLVATVVGLCLLRRRRFAGGGALLTSAALLRLFPALVVAGVALGALGTMVAERRVALSPELRRFAVGGLAALLVWLPLSAVATGGLGSWADFAANSRVHLDTPLANHVGLRTVLSYDAAQRTELAREPLAADPMGRWKQARRARYAQRRWLHAALVLGFALLVARAAARRELWVAAALGVALLPVAAELTGYYWSVLLVLALLMERTPVMGFLVCGFAALSWAIAEHWHWTDQIHVWQSVAGVALAVLAVLVVTHARPRGLDAGAGSFTLQATP